MTDTEATADKPESTPEQAAHRATIKALSRALMKLEGKGSREELKARWDEGKTKYTGDARALVKALAREGVTFTVDADESAKAKRIAKRAAQDGTDAA